MKTPYLSVIIPCYNSSKTIKLLIKSISSSRYKNFETIVVNDGSTDDTKLQVQKVKSRLNIKNLKLVEQLNRGTGAARNAGAKLARGKVLVFADADVVFYPDTLSQVVKGFKNKKVKVVLGTYDKIPANPKPSFFHQFKALRDFSYRNVEGDENLPKGAVGSWITAIDRNFFLKLDGFDEGFRGAGMEDQEMGWRISRATKINFNPKMAVRHNFAGFRKIFKNYYLRSFLWMTFFEKYQTYIGAMTPVEILVVVFANLATLLFILSWFWEYLWYLFILVFIIRVFLGRKFLLFVLKEKGMIFLIKSLFTSQALYFAVFLGVLKYAYTYPKKFLFLIDRKVKRELKRWYI